jgi:hypothetical protein
LARPYMNDQWLGDRLSLFAITREGVAAPIASMTSQNMQFELAENISISPEDKEIATRDLIFAIIKRPPVRNVQSDLKPKYEAQNLEGKDREVAEYLFGAGMLSEYEKYRSDDYYHRTTDKVTIGANVKRHLDTFFAYPDDTYSPYPDSAPLNLALSRLEKLQTGDRDLLTRLQAGNRFAEVLGEARKCDEVLMHYVAKLALAKEGLIAIFNNVQIGKTQAKAKISAAVETNDGIYVLSITGRPESMPDEPMKPLLGATLNPVRPLLGQERVREGAFDEVHVDELIDIVSRIFAVQNE